MLAVNVSLVLESLEWVFSQIVLSPESSGTSEVSGSN